MRRSIIFCFMFATIATMIFSSGIGVANDKDDIIHDGEYYFLEAQHGEKWAKRIRR